MTPTARRAATHATQKTRAWRQAFLQALAVCPDVSKACAAAGVSRSTVYRLRQADETFATEWADTHAKSLDELEAALFKRAIESDTTAAIFILKSHRPDIYGDRTRIEHSGRVRHDVQTMTDRELQDLANGLTSKRTVAR